VGGWVAPRLGPFSSGRVDSVVPRGFEAHARILHPVPGPDRRPTTWAAVCAARGRTPHALMQWNAIAGVVDVVDQRQATPAMGWDGGVPEEGNLVAPAGSALMDVLAVHTSTAADCLFALWEGYGQIWPYAHPTATRGYGPEPVLAAANAAVLAWPRLRHPNRDYLLLSGPLRAAATIGHRWDPNWSQTPNLYWPTDRSWCVATEIDFDSTLVAGTAELLNAVLTNPALEAWQVNPDDSLAHDADTINT
jgi:hypothetical protein